MVFQEKIGLEKKSILLNISNFIAGVNLIFSQQSKIRRTNLRDVSASALL